MPIKMRRYVQLLILTLNENKIWVNFSEVSTVGLKIFLVLNLQNICGGHLPPYHQTIPSLESDLQCLALALRWY